MHLIRTTPTMITAATIHTMGMEVQPIMIQSFQISTEMVTKVETTGDMGIMHKMTIKMDYSVFIATLQLTRNVTISVS